MNNSNDNNTALQNGMINNTSLQKKTVSVDIFDYLTLIFTVASVFFTIYCVYNSDFGFMTAIVHTLFFIYNAAIFIFKEKRLRASAVFPGILLLITTLSHGYYTFHPYLRLIFSCYLFGYFFSAATGTRGFPLSYTADAFHQLSALFLFPVRKVFFPLKNLIRNHRSTNIKRFNGVIIGIILGIPVFAVVSTLLISSDMAFDDVFSGLFNNIIDAFFELFDDFFDSVIQVILTLFITPFVYTFIFLSKHKLTKENNASGKAENRTKELAFISQPVLLGFYSIISICYLLFLVSQLKYMFSAFSGIPAYGYTLSSYARQGFFEMSAVAGINLCLIAAGFIFTKRNDKGELSRIHKIFSVFFCLFTILLIIIATAKMGLYVSELGLTEKRIAVLLADLVFFATFVFILIKLFRKTFPCVKITVFITLSAICLFLSIGTADIVSGFNTHMYLSGYHSEIDIHTVRLTENNFAALKNLHKLSKNTEGEVADEAKAMAYFLFDDYDKLWEHIDEFSDILLIKYCSDNEAELKSYEVNYKSIYNNHSEPDGRERVFEKNISVGSLNFSLNMPANIVKLEISNSVTSAVISYSDNSPFEYNEYVSIDEWAYDPDDMLFAKVFVHTKDGEIHEFHLRFDNETTTEDPERSINVKSQYFSGKFRIKSDNYIMLFSTVY